MSTADAAPASAGGIAAAGKRERVKFALTPLADIMFQLLIFFMLSTSLAPYALLPISGPVDPDSGNAPEPRPQTQADTSAPAQALWHLEKDQIRAGSSTIPLEDLPAALEALKADRIDDIVLFVTSRAEAQDLATVMEQVQQAAFGRLQLIGR
jgi:biopolymer transport protein ExbD